MKSNFISLNRKILDWKWYKKPNTFRLFIHILLKANYIEKEWEDIKIKRGSFVTSYKHLATELGLSVQQIRTSISHLLKTKEISISTHTKYSVISVNKYDCYQKDLGDNTQTTIKQQSNNKQITTTNNVNNNNNENNIIRGVDDFLKVALSDEIWVEHILMSSGKKKSDLYKRGNEFITFLKDRGQKPNSLNHFKSGLAGFIRKEKQNKSVNRHDDITL